MPTKRQKKLALEGSIEKWEEIKEREGIDLAGQNCPLCQLFMDENEDCGDCPVKITTGLSGCRGSPYIQWITHKMESHPEEWKRKVFCPTCTRIAEEEIKFLKSLREKGD